VILHGCFRSRETIVFYGVLIPGEVVCLGCLNSEGGSFLLVGDYLVLLVGLGHR